MFTKINARIKLLSYEHQIKFLHKKSKIFCCMCPEYLLKSRYIAGLTPPHPPLKPIFAAVESTTPRNIDI